MGIEKNIYWIERAQAVTFDATRANNIPVLSNDDRLAANVQAFTADSSQPSAPQPAPAPLPIQVLPIPGGTVQTTTADANGLVGLHVNV